MSDTVDRVVEAIAREAKGPFDKERMAIFIAEMLPQIHSLDSLWIFWFSTQEDAQKDWLPTVRDALQEREMSEDEGPDWKPRILNKEVRVSETTLENGVVVRMHCHFGEVDMAHFERMCHRHPIATYTWG